MIWKEDERPYHFPNKTVQFDKTLFDYKSSFKTNDFRLSDVLLESFDECFRFVMILIEIKISLTTIVSENSCYSSKTVG
jgi:hypothetical protein